MATSPSHQNSIKDVERAQKFAARSILNDWTTEHDKNLEKLIKMANIKKSKGAIEFMPTL